VDRIRDAGKEVGILVSGVFSKCANTLCFANSIFLQRQFRQQSLGLDHLDANVFEVRHVETVESTAIPSRVGGD
jgi:hypothetical protein